MTQLCVFRALQGVGGGGIYALAFTILTEMVPLERLALYGALVSGAFALSNLLGPILGGLINDHTIWRWIFWLNIPAGTVALVLSYLALPREFPFYKTGTQHHKTFITSSSLRRFFRVDFPGAALLLLFAALLVTAIEMANARLPWSSPTIVGLLCASLVSLILFVGWSWLQRSDTRFEPMLPWRMLSNRFTMAAILNAFFVSSAFITCIFSIPLRFQVVNGESPFAAAYRVLALTLATPVGSGLAGALTQKMNLPPFFVLLLGGMIQTLGLGLYTGICADSVTQFSAQYGIEVTMGLGFGISISTVIMVAPLIFEQRDRAVAMGAIGQFRVLGGSICTSAVANIPQKRINESMRSVISSEAITSLQQDITGLDDLPDDVRTLFETSYMRGFQDGMWLVTALCGMACVVTHLMYERNPRSMHTR